MKKNSAPNLDTLIQEIQQLFLNVTNLQSIQIHMEKQILLKNKIDKEVLELMEDLTVLSFHILDAIGQYAPINNTNISKKTSIPKGTVSKNINKLLTKKLIVKQGVVGNKKESVFHLTTLGQTLFTLHANMHHRLEDKKIEFLKQYSTEELQLIIRFLKEYSVGDWAK